MKVFLAMLLLSAATSALNDDACAALAEATRCQCAEWQPQRLTGVWRAGPGAADYTPILLSRSTHVFVGTAERTLASNQRVVFRVSRWYKGGEHDTITVRPTAADQVNSSCDLLVNPGEQWLIFAQSDPDKIPYSIQCRGSRLRSEADSLIKYLGAGWAPKTR